MEPLTDFLKPFKAENIRRIESKYLESLSLHQELKDKIPYTSYNAEQNVITIYKGKDDWQLATYDNDGKAIAVLYSSGFYSLNI